MSIFQKKRGHLALLIICKGNLIVPEALGDKFNVTRSFDFSFDRPISQSYHLE